MVQFKQGRREEEEEAVMEKREQVKVSVSLTDERDCVSHPAHEQRMTRVS